MSINEECKSVPGVQLQHLTHQNSAASFPWVGAADDGNAATDAGPRDAVLDELQDELLQDAWDPAVASAAAVMQVCSLMQMK